jgi:hypothetical protein
MGQWRIIRLSLLGGRQTASFCPSRVEGRRDICPMNSSNRYRSFLRRLPTGALRVTNRCRKLSSKSERAKMLVSAVMGKEITDYYKLSSTLGCLTGIEHRHWVVRRHKLKMSTVHGSGSKKMLNILSATGVITKPLILIHRLHRLVQKVQQHPSSPRHGGHCHITSTMATTTHFRPRSGFPISESLHSL